MAANTPEYFNAEAVITEAFENLGVFQPGTAIPAADASGAWRRLNSFISTLKTMPLTFPFTNREVFSVVANQSTYTIGPGADFDTVRPQQLTGAGLLMTSSSPPVEIPRSLLTDDAYEALQIKTLTSAMWTAVYYNPTYQPTSGTDDWGTVFLWPTPTTTDYSLVLYRGDMVAGFASLTTQYTFPPGYYDCFVQQLSKRLAKPYGVLWTPDMEKDAAQALFLIKRQNFRLTDAAIDPAMTHDRRGGYNIHTGTGG